MRRYLLFALFCLTCAAPGMSVEIEFDYSYDTSGLFAAPEPRKSLERAGNYFLRLRDRLEPIEPQPPVNTVSFRLLSPDRDPVFIENPVIPANTVRIYVSGSQLSPVNLGFAWPSAWTATGTPEFLENVSRRGQPGETIGNGATDYQVAVGWLVLNSSTNWDFGPYAVKHPKVDLTQVAIHELAHVFGYGSADSWRRFVDWQLDTFSGPAAMSAYGGTVPLNSGDDHWAPGTLSHVDGMTVRAEMTGTYQPERTTHFTELDIAGFTDIGWQWAQNGDLELDGDTDSSDLLAMLGNWTGALEPGSGLQTFLQGDMDLDGDKDSADLLALLSGWTGAEHTGSIALYAGQAEMREDVPGVAEPDSTWAAPFMFGFLWATRLSARRLRTAMST